MARSADRPRLKVTTRAQAEAALAKMVGREYNHRRLYNNGTLEWREADMIAVKLYNTDIVTFMPNGDRVIDVGTWKTVCSKASINAHLPAHITLGTDKGVWYWYIHPKTDDGRSWWQDAKKVPYHNGDVITWNGKIRPSIHGGEDVELALRKRIRKYAKLCAASTPMEYKDEEEYGEGRVGLLCVLDSGMIYPELIRRALEQNQSGEFVIYSAFDTRSGRRFDFQDRIYRSVKKYFYRHLGMQA